MILDDQCSISVKPVIDLAAGHTAIDAYEIPANRTDLVAQSRRRLPLRRCRQPLHRYRPHHPLPQPRQRRAARPNPDWQPRSPHPLPPPDQNPRQLAGPTTRTRHLAVAISQRPHLRSQRHRHPSLGQYCIRTSNLARRHRLLYLVRFGAGSITLRTRADSYEFYPASVMTRSARGKLCAISTALSWSVVRAQLSASSWLIPCCWWR